MPTPNTFLFVEPTDNYLDYGSTVLQAIVQNNRQPSQNIAEIKGDQATPENVKSQMQSLNPSTFSGIGHGDENTYTVQNLAVFLDTSSPNLALFQGVVCDLNSCLTAVNLGPALINAGAIAYVGYNQEFWFSIADPAGSTRVVQSPFLAHFAFVAALLQGKSTGDARAAQMAAYDAEIAYWTTGAGKDDPNALDMARILGMNKSSCVFLGQGASIPSPSGALAGGQIPAPIVYGLAGIVLAYALYKALTS
jgi:hypothetical protein